MIVLDASAVLAFLFRESGAEDVARALDESFVSTVNHSEVLARFARDGHDLPSIEARIHGVGLQLIDFDTNHARIAASLITRTRPLGLSLGDRACLALGLALQAPVLTADRAWVSLDGWNGLEIRAIR